MSKFTFIDLFSGIGGFKMALNDNGGHCKGFSEIAKDAVDYYCENYRISKELNLGSITEIENLPKHDLLTAGVPCQSWSIAGKNLGFDDDRGQLWNDTIYLLQKSRPKAFIFENVKGLVDPRNKEALAYILQRIQEAGYHAQYHVLNSFDYGVPQNRIRIYIIGFRNKIHFEKFIVPSPVQDKLKLSEILGVKIDNQEKEPLNKQKDLFGNVVKKLQMSLSKNDGFNDYFLFNDLRNGDTTIHSWDIIETSEREKYICLLLLKNRRKSEYGKLDGNPLSIKHFKELDEAVRKKDLDELVKKGILKIEEYTFEILDFEDEDLEEKELFLLDTIQSNLITTDILKLNKEFLKRKISFSETINSLKDKKIVKCVEKRYDFKNTKISSGLFGVNRIFLPTANLFSTLVASDTNDFVSEVVLDKISKEQYREDFLRLVYLPKKYRKISKEEACGIQGFPSNFELPEARNRWMKLIGNSVSVPVIDKLCKSIIETGVFEQRENKQSPTTIDSTPSSQKA